MIALAREADSAEIDDFVLGQPAAALYHRPALARVIRRAGGLAVATFVARREPGGPIAGILPVALTQSLLFGTYATSLPYFNYGGVLAADADVAAALAEAGWAWASERGARSLVLRHTIDRPLALPETRGKATLKRALPPDPDALWSAIGSKTRNLVRKAEKAGLAAAVEGAGGLGDFHAIFSENMRDLGTPALGKRFFRVLFEEAGPAAAVHVVRRGRVPMAAAVTLRFRDRVEVPWASALRRYNNVAANMLLYWHLLRYAIATGARVFDFGRSTPDSGPYKFKLQWGATPEPLPWYYAAREGRAAAGDLSPANPRFALAIRLWRLLPVPVAREAGSHLAASLP